MIVIGLVTIANEPDCQAAVERASGRFHAAADLGEVVAGLAGSEPPGALVIDGGRLSEASRGTMEAIARRGLLVPVRLYLPQAGPEMFGEAWRLRVDDVVPVFSATELAEALRRPSINFQPRALGRHLMRRLQPVGPSASLVHLLADEAQSATWTVSRIVERLSVRRSAIYSSLRAQGLPAIEQFQTLFRLTRGVTLIHRGGSAEDAAHVSGYYDATAFRKALRSRLGLTMKDVRKLRSWQAVAHRWEEVHRCWPEAVTWGNSTEIF